MEGLGAGSPRTSPSSSPRSLDVRRLSTRADSAYSSFSADSGGPELPPPSPGSHLLPCLPWDYTGSGRPGSQEPQPVAAARGGQGPSQVQGAPEPLSKQATPLLFALAAEAAAAARAAEPPSPPASRAAYRLRLQGAQRRVLRATSFQRKELRMSLPARPRGLAASPRPASLSHPGEDPELQRRTPASCPMAWGRLTNPPREWRFSEPGPELQPGESGLVQQGGGVTKGDPRMLARPDPQLLQPRVLAELGGHWIREPPEDRRLPEDPESGSLKLAHTYRPPSGRRSASCEAMDPCAPSAQATPQEAEPSRPVFHAKLCSMQASDQLPGVALDQRVDQAPVPPEYPLPECPETPAACDCWQGLSNPVAAKPTCCSPPEMANGDGPPVDHNGPLALALPATVEGDPLKPLPEGALGIEGSDPLGLHDHTAPGMAQSGSNARLEELIQELTRLDPSLSDTLATQPSPPAMPLALLHGLIPLAEVWAAMRPAEGEAGEGPAASEEGSYLFSSTSLLSTSQETRPVSLTTQPMPAQSCGQGLPESKHLIQAKKVELAELLQKMLQDLEAERERLQRATQAWARRRAALEAAIGQACAPRDLERFSRFLTDLERVLGLLLLLGSRLSRVHRALARLGTDGDLEELASLRQRLGLLQRQQEDARELREHVARRERTLREVLERALPAEELRAYRALLAGKAAVLAQQRGLDERARLLQDQLDAVRSDLGQSPLAPKPTWSPGPCLSPASPLPPPLC